MFFRRKQVTVHEHDRRRATAEERAQWDAQKKVREQQEREEIARKLRYLELQAEVFARRES